MSRKQPIMPKPSNKPHEYGGFEFTDSEIESLFPNIIYDRIGKTTPEEMLEAMMRKDNLIDQYPTEQLLWFSRYQAMSDKQRAICQYVVNNCDIGGLLTFVGSHNKRLFDHIELLHLNKVPVIEWFEIQILSFKQVMLKFDTAIKRKLDWNQMV